MAHYTEHSTIVHAFGVKGSNLLPIASRFCLRQNRYAIWITGKIQFSERLVKCKMKVNKDTEVIDRENLEKNVLFNF